MMARFSCNELRRFIAQNLGCDDASIGDQLRLVEDLAIDSLGMHALLIDIEEAGGHIPSAEALEHVSTVADLFAAVAAAAPS